MNKILQWLRSRRKMHKVSSVSGELYYIDELASVMGGWIAVDKDECYPFVFWKVKPGETTIATPEEVERYQRYWELEQR